MKSRNTHSSHPSRSTRQSRQTQQYLKATQAQRDGSGLSASVGGSESGNRRRFPIWLPMAAALLAPYCSAQAAWQSTPPPIAINVQSNRRGHVFYKGDAISFSLSGAGASRYEVRDYYGNLVDQGAVTGTSIVPAVQQPGWYKLNLVGNDQGLPFGTSVGSSMFCIIRDDSNFPKMPAPGTYGGDGLIDAVTRGVFAYGPQRHLVNNASSPDVEIARLDKEIALDQQYYTPFDSYRKRDLLIVFPNGTGDLVGVRKIVDHFKTSVRYWEARNEPNFAMSATAFVNNELAPFYQTVKSVDPTLKVLGPGAVSVGPPLAGWNDEFFRAGGGKYIDVFSFHAYNCVNGDLNLTRLAMDQVTSWLKTYNLSGIEKWQTEQGFMGPVYGAYQPRLQGRWTMLEMMVFEQYGIPKEHNHYWYDRSGGFWDEPRWVQNEDGSLNAVGPLLRVWSEELFGTRFSAALDFGNPRNKLFIGSLFTGPGKQVAAIMTSGDTQAKLELNLSSATSVKVVSPFGVESTLPVVNGKVTVPVSELPTYVEYTGTLSVTPQNWGANLALQTGATAAASGSSVHPIDAGVSNPPSKVINGKLESWYWSQSNTDRLWESNNATFPAWFEVRLPAATSIDRVVVYSGIPWQWDGSILDYELQVDQNGQWVTVDQVKEPVNTFRNYTKTNWTTVDSFYSERCVFTHSFAPVTTGKIRLLVNDVTWGGASNKDLKDAGAQGGVHQISLREIEIYNSGVSVTPVPPPANKPPVAVNDTAWTPSGMATPISVLANDSDPDSGPSPLSIASVTTPAHGAAAISGSNVLYTPAAGFAGSDAFSYTITDGNLTSTASVAVTVAAADPNRLAGLRGDYFAKPDLTAPVLTRLDSTVNFDWQTGSPATVVPVDGFSARWTGTVTPRFSENYTFAPTSDDGVRLWVNGVLLVDNWTDHAPTEVSGSIKLVAGQPADLKMEYYENFGGAVAQLRWSSPSQVKEIVPATALSTAPLNVNKPPIAVDDSAVTNESTAVTIPVLANDSDPDGGPNALRVNEVGVPSGGVATIAAGGVLYQPNAGFYGADRFTYTLSDGAATATANVSVSVNSTAKATNLVSGGLTALQIGTAPGSSRILADGSWELNGGGVGVSGTSDALRMEAQTVSGDFRIALRVRSVSGPAAARAGLLLREGVQAGARTVAAEITPAAQLVMETRLTTGGVSSETSPAGADAIAPLPNAWLQLERTGDVVRVSISSDGVSYRPVASYTVPGLSASLQVGVLASSGAADVLARAVVDSWSLSRPVTLEPVAQNGLLGVYFNSNNLTLPTVSRLDATVNFDWVNNSPHPALLADGFSARWTGQVTAPSSGVYTFYTQSDDGVRLWLGGQLLIDNWTQHGITENSGTVTLQAGAPVDLKLEYFESTGLATCKLLWSGPSLAKQAVPASALRPSVAATALGPVGQPVTSLLADGSRQCVTLGTGLLAGSVEQGGFFNQTHSGDFQIAVKIRSLSVGTPATALMLREGLGATDRFAAVQLASNGSLSVWSRTTTGGAVSSKAASGVLVPPNAWLLVERRGDRIALAVSPDDLTYTNVGNVQLSGLSQLVSAGAFLGGASGNAQGTVALGDFELTPLVSKGLTGEYFATSTLTLPKLTRVDAGVDFNWGIGSPDPTLGNDKFSARWTGRLKTTVAGLHTFFVQSDDGARLYVNGQLMVNNWTDHALVEDSASMQLGAGVTLDLRLEYYENTGSSTARLLWTPPGQAKQVIAVEQLQTP
jgi:regulation of enolase protein 1 (concanavalin A-like superfamily)